MNTYEIEVAIPLPFGTPFIYQQRHYDNTTRGEVYEYVCTV